MRHGVHATIPGGVAAAAQSAADQNAGALSDEDKVKLRNVFSVRSLLSAFVIFSIHSQL
jgi:hypothetical protein